MREKYCGFPNNDNNHFDTETISRIIIDMKRGKAADIDGLTVEHLYQSSSGICITVNFYILHTRSASAVISSEKSSVNTNTKFPTRFPMSLRWSSYVAPKSPKEGLKNAKRPFFL